MTVKAGRRRGIKISKAGRYWTRRSYGEYVFDSLNLAGMVLVAFVTLYPFWYILVISLNTGSDAAVSPIWLWPRKFTLENYVYVLRYENLQRAFLVTVGRCVLGSILFVLVNMLSAYALSKRKLPGRKWLLFFFMMPMFIGGSIISNFVVIVKAGLLNSFLVFILPGAFSFFAMILMRTFIEELPVELQESAMLDGASHGSIFFRIVFPLSLSIVAAFMFFNVVAHWLDLNTNLFYITKKELYTLQYILYQVIKSSEANKFIDFTNNPDAIRNQIEARGSGAIPTPQVIRMAVMVVVTFPILFVYPFFQRYFIKGMFVGAIKA